MSLVPTWVQVLSALLTPTIAMAVAVIAFLQWRTAHQKVVLDLFDRRLSIVNEADDLYLKVRQTGVRIEQHILVDFHAVRARARYLFGDDVNDYLKRWHEGLFDMGLAAQMMDSSGADPLKREEYVKSAHEGIKVAMKFRQEFFPLCERYLLMDQKIIRTPLEWFHDRNSIRTSYDDQKAV